MSKLSSAEISSMSAAQLSSTATMLFVDGSIVLRLLQRYRPYICPFEAILPIIPEDSDILDVGCGGGLFLGLLAANGRIRSGLGFDSSVKAIAIAKHMSRFFQQGEGRLQLEFQQRDASDGMPDGYFDVVSIIDVMHHVPPLSQRSVLEMAASRLRPSGLLIYKDMVRRPLWRALANRLHDLVLARQWIHYAPIDHVEQWARDLGLQLVDARSFNRFCYGHELRVFRRG